MITMAKIVKKEEKMKKLTLGLGSLVAIAAPVSAVVACGSSESSRSMATAQSTVSVSAQSAITTANIVAKGSTIATFNNGVYTTGSVATAADVHLPNSIEAIAKANVASKIASTGHYSILINLLKGTVELTDAEALLVHQAFVTAYNSKLITNPKINSLDANALKAALEAAKTTSTGLGAKLNLGMFK